MILASPFHNFRGVVLHSFLQFLTVPLPNAARPARRGRAVGAAWGPLPTSGWTPSPFAAAHSEPNRLGPVAVPNACAVRSGVFGLLNVGQESGNRGLRPGGNMAGTVAGDMTRPTANDTAAFGLSCQRLTFDFATPCVPTVFADRWGHSTEANRRAAQGQSLWHLQRCRTARNSVC